MTTAEQQANMRKALHWVLISAPNPRSTLAQIARHALDMEPGQELSKEEEAEATRYVKELAS